VERAVDALGGTGEVTPDVRHRLAGTVEALASGGMPADVAPGRLTRDLQPSGLEAFGALSGFAAAASTAAERPRPTLVPASARRTAAGRKVTDAKAADATAAGATARIRAAEAAEREAVVREKKISEATARLTGLEEALESAIREADERKSDEERARTELESAAARVADLEARMEQARDAERSARRALSSATKAASEAEMMRARTARDVAAARKQLEDLQPG
jgi:hypothetical protein